MSVVVAETGGDFCPDQGTWKDYGGSICEIEEEDDQNYGGSLDQIKNVDPLPSITEESENTSLFSICLQEGGSDDVVYVAVGKSGSSMDALQWTLNYAVFDASTTVCLIHVFPETRYIPTPLGKIPVSQVNREQKENYMIQERSKRREFLQKYLDVCSVSKTKVKVDTILIESDLEAKALLDLIPILNITKLVLGTPKSSLRKLRSRKGNEIAGQVLLNAPEFCDVKIVCEGKEVEVGSMPESPSPHGSPNSPKPAQNEDNQRNDSVGCTCFKLKAIA